MSFFFFLGSLTPRFTRVATSPPIRCANCLDLAPTMYEYDTEKVVTLFFIPVAKFGKKRLWMCDKCNYIEESKPDEETIRQIEHREMSQQGSPLPTWGLTRCSNCEKEINISGRYKFCPYCGVEIKEA